MNKFCFYPAIAAILLANGAAIAEPVFRPRPSRQVLFAIDPALIIQPGKPRFDSVRRILALKIHKEGYDCEILYGPADIQTSLDGLRTLDSTLRRMKSIRRLMIMLGAQDREAGISPEHTRANLEQLILEARKRFPEIKVALIPPFVGDPAAEFHELKAIYEGIASNLKVELIPLPAGGQSGRMLQANPEDTKLVVDTVWEIIAAACR